MFWLCVALNSEKEYPSPLFLFETFPIEGSGIYTREALQMFCFFQLLGGYAVAMSIALQ